MFCTFSVLFHSVMLLTKRPLLFKDKWNYEIEISEQNYISLNSVS